MAKLLFLCFGVIPYICKHINRSPEIPGTILRKIVYGVFWFSFVFSLPEELLLGEKGKGDLSRLRAATLISVFCEWMCDRSRLVWFPSEGLAFSSFWRILDAENNCDRNREALQMKTLEARWKVRSYTNACDRIILITKSAIGKL